MKKFFPKWVWFDAVAITVMAGLLTYVLWDAWSTRLDYAFGYLMPMFMAYVIWDRFPKIKIYFESAPSKDIGGFSKLFLGMFFFLYDNLRISDFFIVFHSLFLGSR